LLLAASLAALLFAPSTKVRMNWPLPALLAAMVALAAYQYLAGQLDYSYRLTTLVLAVVGMLMAYGLGRWIVESSLVPTAMYAICIAIVAGGVLSHAVQWMQVLDVGSLPVWAYSPMERNRPFRAHANLGQPNQLAAYFAMGLVALLYLRSRGVSSVAVVILAAVMTAGIALTQSRMGILMAVLLAAACFIGPLHTLAGDRRRAGVFWVAALVGYLLAWIVGPLLATNLDQAIAPDALLSQSSTRIRLVMWADALQVIRSTPWLGVGAGQYASAQYWVAGASPFTEGAPYVHNLLLQVGAEYGVPVGMSLLALLIWWTFADHQRRLADPAIAAAWTLGLLIILHSFLEWPLWVFFIAVPAGLLFGLAEPQGTKGVTVEARTVLAPVGIAVLCYLPLMIADYDRVSVSAQLLFGAEAVETRASPEVQMLVFEIGDATFFKPQMERQVLALLPPRKPVEKHYLELTRRVLSQIPDSGVIARYTTVLALQGDVEEALRHVERMRVFSRTAEGYQQAEQSVLKGIALEGPELDPLRQRLADLRP
jgi:O-antigen ligase